MVDNIGQGSDLLVNGYEEVPVDSNICGKAIDSHCLAVLGLKLPNIKRSQVVLRAEEG